MNSKLLLLVGVLAVLSVVRAADAEAEHDADTPLRQAQRAMLAERETATATHANEDVLGMRLQAVAEGAGAAAAAYPEKEQPHARRISGAAQSFLPDDKMCVMCQFLSQRIQLDLVGGVHAPMYGGAYGGVATSVIAGVAPVSSFLEEEDAADSDSEDLIELADSDEEEEADEAEEADEQEDEAEAEEEDAVLLEVAEEDEDSEESEDEEESDEEEEAEEEEAALIQVGGSDEGEWLAPEYADSEAAPVPTALIESEADDFQTPQYIDGVYHTVEGEEAETADETDEAEAGTADASEAAFFESSALASVAANDEWVTPEFAAAPAAPAVEMADAELTALLAVAEEMVAPADAATWSTPTYSDAQKPTGNKAYARIVSDAAHEEEEEAEAEAEPALLEETAAQAQQTEVKLFAPRIIRSRSARWGGRLRRGAARIDRFRSKGADLFHTAKRYRAADAIVARPRWNRHEPHSPRHMSQRLIAGMALRNAEHAAYDRLEHYCSTRLPEAYGKYCRPVLRRFRRITEGLSYGDRIPHVCMRVNLCKPSSYVVASPHDRLEERTF